MVLAIARTVFAVAFLGVAIQLLAAEVLALFRRRRPVPSVNLSAVVQRAPRDGMADISRAVERDDLRLN